MEGIVGEGFHSVIQIPFVQHLGRNAGDVSHQEAYPTTLAISSLFPASLRAGFFVGK